jgi:phytoene synthase
MHLYPRRFREAVRRIFKRGSTTYYYSSIFFPQAVKDDIFTLYAFVRVADDFVDAIPQDVIGFESFCRDAEAAFGGRPCGNEIIDAFVAMAVRRSIPYEYVAAFFDSMRADTVKHTYATFAELEAYIYGSAEVIGLMMAKILELAEESYQFARLQGSAMQLINFIRDVKEDTGLGRTYLPGEDMDRFGVTTLDPRTSDERSRFAELIRFEIARYRDIQKRAEAGYAYIPASYLVPVKTAADMYNWTAGEIDRNPFLVLERKVKPRPLRVISRIAVNYFGL